jgi:hypothetical protein
MTTPSTTAAPSGSKRASPAYPSAPAHITCPCCQKRFHGVVRAFLPEVFVAMPTTAAAIAAAILLHPAADCPRHPRLNASARPN